MNYFTMMSSHFSQTEMIVFKLGSSVTSTVIACDIDAIEDLLYK